MQSVEEFMRQLVEEQVAFEKEEKARRLVFHHRFYEDDCHWGKGLGRLGLLQSLKVLSLSTTATTAEVIASRLANGEPELYCEIRFRLRNRGQGWLIYGVDLRCCCGGEGKSREESCPSCHGTGWKDTNPALAQMTKGF